MLKTKPCALCGSIWHSKGHHKPKKGFKPPTKRLRPESKKTRLKRLTTRQEWFELNPGPTWNCYLRIVPNCLRVVTIETLNIEHPDSKTRRPDLKYDAKKLKPACGPCNEFKGSLSEAEARKKAKEIYG